jgi:hypothetical protein
MHVPFESLPDTTRIWIYQSNRPFTPNEVDTISNTLLAFTNQWTAHGEPLKSSFKIEYNQFVALAVDEGLNMASGCSIDSSTRIFKQLGNELQIDFFDRTTVYFVDLKGKVFGIGINALKESLGLGRWNRETLMVNTAIATKEDLKKWIVPAGESWLARYLPKVTAF